MGIVPVWYFRVQGEFYLLLLIGYDWLEKYKQYLIQKIYTSLVEVNQFRSKLGSPILGPMWVRSSELGQVIGFGSLFLVDCPHFLHKQPSQQDSTSIMFLLFSDSLITSSFSFSDVTNSALYQDITPRWRHIRRIAEPNV